MRSQMSSVHLMHLFSTSDIVSNSIIKVNDISMYEWTQTNWSSIHSHFGNGDTNVVCGDAIIVAPCAF